MQKPSIGRIVWFWANAAEAEDEITVLDDSQACTAQVCYVNADDTVDLTITDHTGDQTFKSDVTLHDPVGDESHNHARGEGYATWMPYQKAQHEKAQAGEDSKKIPG